MLPLDHGGAPLFYGHIGKHGRLNGMSDLQMWLNEAKDETSFRMNFAGLRWIWGWLRNLLNHGNAIAYTVKKSPIVLNRRSFIELCWHVDMLDSYFIIEKQNKKHGIHVAGCIYFRVKQATLMAQ